MATTTLIRDPHVPTAETPGPAPDQDAELARRAAAQSATEGAGCHAGAEQMKAAAKAAGNAELLEGFERDYPKGPHEQPQSMCPAFGSLRVGLHMRRVGTILSGSACCVYGLTFTSHFYGARRSVGYVPFNSETLVTGKLYEDIRDAVHAMAKPEDYDAIVVTNLCVPTASGIPLQALPPEIDGVRIVGIDVPGFGVPTHAEAKDVLSGAMLKYARGEAATGPVMAPREGVSERPTVTLVGEMFPADPVVIGQMLEPMGLAAGPVVPVRDWRDLYAALGDLAKARKAYRLALELREKEPGEPGEHEVAAKLEALESVGEQSVDAEAGARPGTTP